MAAGDAAASAYLHPLADAVQVRHILRAGAHAARVLELDGDSHATGRVAELATAPAIDVLVRYPRVGVGTNRVSELMYELDAALRGESR